MPDYDAVLYDTAAFGSTANTEHLLFAVAQGGDATHTEAFTNSRGAGALPQQEKFRIKKLSVFQDFNSVVADSLNMWLASFLDIVISNRSVFKAPLALLADRNDFSGHYSQATAADEALIGLVGNGYHLEIPIEIPQGASLRVRVFQGTALSGTGKNVKIALTGILTTPS